MNLTLGQAVIELLEAACTCRGFQTSSSALCSLMF
jgi:hypothetical protein